MGQLGHFLVLSRACPLSPNFSSKSRRKLRDLRKFFWHSVGANSELSFFALGLSLLPICTGRGLALYCGDATMLTDCLGGSLSR